MKIDGTEYLVVREEDILATAVGCVGLIMAKKFYDDDARNRVLGATSTTQS